MSAFPESKIRRIFCSFVLLVVGLTISAAPLSGFSPLTPQEDSEATSGASAEARYKQELLKARKLVKECRRISLKFFDSSLAKSYDWKAKFDPAAKKLAEHRPVFEKAALDWFFVCDEPSKDLIKLASAISARVGEAGDLELTWKILRRIEDHFHNPEDVELQRQLALIGIKTNRFEKGVEFLRRSDAKEAVEAMENQLNKNMFILCPMLIDKWEREKKLREEEAKADDLPRVKIELSTGDVVVELFENEAPETVANFINLVEAGLYDDAYCHPVAKGIVMQSGMVHRSFAANVDYVIKNESRLPDRRSHFAGSLTMSSAEGGVDSANTAFGITLVPNPDLDWNGKEDDNVSQPVFGRVVSGIEHVAAMPATVELDPESEEQKMIKGVEPGHIKKATVIRKRDHEYKFEKIRRGK